MFNLMSRSNGRNAWATVITAATISAGASAQPNIEVRILNAVQSPGAEFSFEPTDVGSSVPLIVVVRNIGSESLQFPSSTPVFFSGGFSDQFELIQPPLEAGNRLSPNGSTAFRVDFSPDLPKAEMFTTVVIPTNDPDSPVFSLSLRGLVPVPELAVSIEGQSLAPRSQANFPQTAVGETNEMYLMIANSGDRPLEIADELEVFGGFGADQFSIQQSAIGALQPGDSVEVIVVFAPTRTGSATATVGISSNDIGNLPAGRFAFNVRGVGTAAIAGDAEGDDEPAAGNHNSPEEDTSSNNENGNGSTGADNAVDDDLGHDTDTDNDGTFGDSNEIGFEEDEDLQQQRSPITPCGFGGPFGLALGLASLASLRTGGRHRRV